MGVEQSRRDDIECICYTLIYLANGFLPWQKIVAKHKKEKYQRILNYKVTTDIDTLCKGLPKEFMFMLKHSRSIEFEEEPDYDTYINSFRSLLNNYNQLRFDWEIINEEIIKKRKLTQQLLTGN